VEFQSGSCILIETRRCGSVTGGSIFLPTMQTALCRFFFPSLVATTVFHSHTVILFYFVPSVFQSSQREMDREMRELDKQEKQITLELKQRAKTVPNGKDPALAALAKQLVQVRKQKEKMLAAKAHIGAVGMQATSMASQVAAASAIGSVTSAMGVANSAMDVKATMKIMQEFQRENERLEVKQEMMDDALIDAFDTDEVNEEAEQVTNQVLAELGVEMDSKMVGLDAPMNKPQGEQLSQEEADALESVLPDLKARLNAL
jgi:charged multivesicular body protein 2B